MALRGGQRENPTAFDACSRRSRSGTANGRNAPVLVLSVAKVDFTHSGKPNRHAFHDVGQAAAYLTLQATALGLYVHQMAGFDAAKARQLLSIPKGHEPVAMMAVGYLDDPSRTGSVRPAQQASTRAQAARTSRIRRELGQAMVAGCGRQNQKREFNEKGGSVDVEQIV